MLVHLRRWFNFWYNIVIRFIDDNCTYHAAALTFTLLLSLVPLLTVIFTILTFIPYFDDYYQQIQQFIFTYFVPSAGDIIEIYLQQFIEQAIKLSSLNFIFFLITAFLTLFNIEAAFNTIWQIKNPRSWTKRLFLYLFILILIPLILAVSFIGSAYLLAHAYIPKILSFFMPSFFTTAAFTLLYKILPSGTIPWRHCFLSAIIAAILFETAKYGFTWYLIYFPTYEILYGALAAIPMFLTWLYISWLITLFGAEVNYALTCNTRSLT